jgi:glyoxylase-like metal-dependent hydrolase (beta-lactamase superfamily II)
MTPPRRDFLKMLLGGAICANRAFAQPASITAGKLTDNFSLITGSGSNVLILTGPDGVLMVDGGPAERSADLLRVVAEQSKGRPVQALFNTDWHWAHTGSNETLGKAGAKIIAHENTKLWLGAEVFVEWENRTYKPRPPAALPNQTFYTTGKMTFGKERIEYGYMLQAHTDGDIYVFFPGPNILVAGDVLSVGSYPILDYSTGGWITGLVDANAALLKLANAETRIVPGNGPVQTRADLQAQHDMCVTLKDRILKLMRQGMGPEDMIAAAPTKDFDAKWGDPKLFLSNAYRGLWGHVRELGGIV